MQDSIFVGLDVHKATVAVATAEGVRGGEIRALGSIPHGPAEIAKLAAKLAKSQRPLRFCYEAGPCGYGLHRQLTELGHDCIVVAPSLIPIKAGDRVKTDRRDAVMLAKLHRAGELTAVWVPDDAHEAMRDLVRARATSRQVLSKARQHLQGFLLRHGRVYSGTKGWTRMYRRWLSTVCFDHPAQQIVLQDYRPRPIGALKWVQSTPRRNYQGWQYVGQAGTGRRRVDLSPTGSRQQYPEKPHRAVAEADPRHCLEGAGPSVCTISPSFRRREAADRRDDRHRPGNGRLPLGDCPRGKGRRHAVSGSEKQHRCPRWGAERGGESSDALRAGSTDARLLDRGSPKTKPRSCGNQPAYESLLNRRLQLRLLPWASPNKATGPNQLHQARPPT